MDAVLKWPWSQSLAMAREGDLLKVKEILFGTLQDHLGKAGVRDGATLEHLGRDDDGVAVRLSDGNGVKVSRHQAWFIVVEPAIRREAKQV